MPAVDTGGAKTGGPRVRVKKKAAPKKPAAKVTRPSTPDQADRNREARVTGTPKGPAVKVRMYAHPQRKEPQKVITKAIAEQDTARAKRAETRAVIRQIHVTPVPSPDATDSTRSPAQQAHDRAFTKRSGQQAHIRAIRKAHRGSGVRAVKAELEGKGVVAKTLSKLGERGARNAGGGEPILAKTPKYASAINENIGSRAVKDAINLPATVVPSIYVPTAGAVEAAQGRPERLKKFGEDLKQHDPVYNTAAAAVQAVRGNEKAAKSHFNKAKKAASEHPGFTAAEFYGVRGAAGRAAGASVRGAAKVSGSQTLKRIGTTERAPARLAGTNVVEQRRYSKDLFRKHGEVRRDRRNARDAQDLRDKAAHATDPDRRAQLEQQARAKDPTTLRDRDIHQRVDEHVDAVEQVRRQHRSKTTAETRKVVRKVARKAGPVLNLAAQRIVRPEVPDLKAYVRELEAEHSSLGPAGKRTNERLRVKLGKAIDRAESGKLDLAKVKLAVDEYAKQSHAGQAALVSRGMLDAEQADRASLMPYAVRRMGAKHDGDKLVDPAGRTLTTAAIKAHMAAHGEKPPAFLSQAPNARGARNFYVNAAKPPKATGAKRTGEATRKGTFDAHPDTLTEQAARTQGLTDAFDHFQQFVDEFGYRDPRGRGGIRTKRTKRDADNLARDLSAKGDSVEWQAVRVNPFGASKEQLHQMLEGAAPGTPVHTALTKALAGDDGEGPWAIVPKAAAERMQEHLRVLNPGNAGRAFRQVNSAFRKTVLATSLPWLVGNVTEASLRTALAKAGPRSYVTGRKVLKRAKALDPAKSELAQARTVGGGHFGFAERQHVHTDLSQYTDGVIKDIGRHLGRFWRAPGPKHAAATWNGWTHGVFQVVNKTVEQQFQTAMLGKAIRDSPLMNDRLLKLSKKATDDAAKGILDRNTAVAFGREIDRMYGRYGKYSPDMRKALALYTPFAAWTLNAVTFVAKTLPRDHPVALAVIAATVNATDEWRKDHGLDKFVDGAVPGWLQGSIPAADGTHYRAPARYTPFGFFTDPLGSTAGAVLPQASGILAAFRGQSWNGATLRDENGQPVNDIGRAEAAAKSFAESTVPFLALGGRIKAKGTKSAILDATIGKVEPKAETAPTLSPPRIKKSSVSGYGKGAYGSGSYGGSSYGGSPFK